MVDLWAGYCNYLGKGELRLLNRRAKIKVKKLRKSLNILTKYRSQNPGKNFDSEEGHPEDVKKAFSVVFGVGMGSAYKGRNPQHLAGV